MQTKWSPKWQFITKILENVPWDRQTQGICMQNADFSDSGVEWHHPCNIQVMQLMHHSEFDMFKMASRLVDDKFYKPVRATPYL